MVNGRLKDQLRLTNDGVGENLMQVMVKNKWGIVLVVLVMVILLSITL